MERHVRVTALATAIAMLAGCASPTAQQVGRDYGTPLGCTAGAILGGLIGAHTGNEKDKTRNAAIGAVIGGGLGCVAGSVWQSRMKELQRIAEEENLSISMETLDVATQQGGQPGPQPAAQVAGSALVAQVQETGMFATGSATLTPDGRRQVQKLAAAFAQTLTPQAAGAQGAAVSNDSRHFLVVGHTDASGTAAFNQRLSEQRAREVGRVLQAAGIPANRIYYQGAGSSRPLADNTTHEGRSINRRVEINELSSEEVLVRRVNQEASSAKYLAHGTTTKAAPAVRSASASQPEKSTAPSSTGQPAKATPPSSTSQPRETVAGTTKPAPVVASPSAPTAAKPAKASSLAKVNFGGVPAAQITAGVGRSIKPKSGGFALISSAQASEIPVQSCDVDAPRETGKVLSLASGQPLKTYRTNEYLPGYNNKVWANTLNGHLVTISPVSILRDNAAVGRQPFLQVVQNYEAGKKNTLKPIQAVANTYEGEDKVLYRVFATDARSAVSCIDVVFSKGNATAVDGQLFYDNGSAPYAAEFVPIKS